MGTNVQKKLIVVHDLDIPWRPADLEQRAGRIIRQGNENKQVQIFRYVTKGTSQDLLLSSAEAPGEMRGMNSLWHRKMLRSEMK